ncbi:MULTISPECIES: DUF6571 family protein [Streptomyces]|uniref:DUF6571 family protein n=1 Tax=Streptomyces TaxID=1883 RepID=UPI000ABCE717|nr:hypothetical protein [Streptomyces sp. F-7]
MPEFSDLLNARLGSLKDAVDDWTETVKKLEKLDEQAAKGLLRKAEKADWKGENASVTLPFVKKTAKEFRDAAKEAQSIRNILRDALTEFKAAKTQLAKAVEDAPKKGIRVDSNGVVSYQIHPDRRAKDYDGPEPKEADFEQVRTEIKEALKRANEADEVASRALRTLVGKDKHNFSGTEYDSLKQAGRAQDSQDARAAAKIVAKGDDASPEEIARLNKYFENNRGDRYFAERFALEVGVKGNLEYWVDMGDPSDGSRLGVDHPKEIKELQKNWSLTLATATHSDSAEMNRWKADMIKAGDDIIQSRGTSAHGFQVMSNLMREGVYDRKFLREFGDAVVVSERRMTGDGRISAGQAWGSGLAMPPKLNWDGKDIGSDPMIGYLEALGHNPDASLDFFTRSTTLKDEKLSNWDYFVGQGKDARDWPVDHDGRPKGFANLGHALEAATLGYAYDDKNPGVPSMRTEEQIEAREARTALMSKIVETYGSADAIDKHPGISDSLAKMAAGHIDSLNYSTATFGSNEGVNGRDTRFGAENNHLADFDAAATTNFLRALASDEDAYNTVSAAQQAYGTSLMAAQGEDQGDVKRVAMHSIMMHGMLDQARFEAIGQEFADEKEAANRELEKQGAWRNFAAGAVIGTTVGVASELIIPTRAAAAIAVPLAFEVAGGAAETYMSNQTLDWLKENEFDNKEEALEGIEAARATGQQNAMAPFLNYAVAHRMSEDEIWDFSAAAESSYNDGRARSDTKDVRGY